MDDVQMLALTQKVTELLEKTGRLKTMASLKYIGSTVEECDHTYYFERGDEDGVYTILSYSEFGGGECTLFEAKSEVLYMS